jgi:oligopeptidase B
MAGWAEPSSTRMAALLGRVAARALWASEAGTHARRRAASTRPATPPTRPFSSSSSDAWSKHWRDADAPTAARFLRRAAAWFPASEQTAPETIGPWRYWTEQGAGVGGPVMLRAPVTAVKDIDGAVPPPTLVLDAAAVLDSLGAAGGILGVKPSPCASFVAVLADAGGEPCASVRAIGRGGAEVARLPGALGVEWGAPGTGTLFYTLDRGGDGRPAEVRVAPGLALGGSSSSRAAAHQTLLHLPDARSHLALGRTKDGHWLTATAVRRDCANPHVLRLGGGGAEAAPAFARVGGGSGSGAATVATAGEPSVETFVEGDGRGGLLLLTNERAGGEAGEGAASPHEAWLGWAPGPAVLPGAWAPLIPRRRGVVITDIDAFCGPGTADTILLYERDTELGAPGLSTTRLAWGGGVGGGPPAASPPAPIALPGGPAAWACITPGGNACSQAATARIISSSPLASPRPWDVGLGTGAVAPLPLPPAARAAAAAVAADAAGLALRRLTIPCTDGSGARIPLTVIERDDPPTAQAPPGALLVLYGAYGTPLDADFEPLWLTLAAEGWRVVLAGVRGGGDLGRAWHAAGRGANRPAAAADAEAAAAWAAGPARDVPVVASAESAGGLLAGHLLQAGGLAGAVLRAPFLDICKHVRPAGDPGGVTHPPAADPVQGALAQHEAGEWAAPGDVAGLAAACPATRLRSGPSPPTFPPLRITTGLKDARVPADDIAGWMRAWEAAAAAAGRGLTEANPALVHLLPGCGHEGPQGRDALAAMAADAAFAVKVARDARERRGGGM